MRTARVRTRTRNSMRATHNEHFSFLFKFIHFCWVRAKQQLWYVCITSKGNRKLRFIVFDHSCAPRTENCWPANMNAGVSVLVVIWFFCFFSLPYCNAAILSVPIHWQLRPLPNHVPKIPNDHGNCRHHSYFLRLNQLICQNLNSLKISLRYYYGYYCCWFYKRSGNYFLRSSCSFRFR